MYGGTKSEMERLLQDAQKLSGVEYNIDNLGDVYDAIHVIQGDLGLTGVAAQEAASTFSGSFGAMKAAAANLLGNLALGENVGPSMQTLIQTVSTFLTQNLIPMIGNVLKTLPTAIGTAITTGGPLVLEAGKTLINNIVSGITTVLPNVLETAGSIVTNIKQGIQNNLPSVVQQGSSILDSILNADRKSVV